MFRLAFSGQFRKDIKILVKRNYDFNILKNALAELEINGTLPATFKLHKLSGIYLGYWEAHIKADWLIIWKVSADEILLVRTGTHSDLF